MKKAIILVTVLLAGFMATSQITIGNRSAPLTTNQDIIVLGGSVINTANITAEGRTVTFSGSTAIIKSTICCHELVLNAGTLTLANGVRIYCDLLTIKAGFTSIVVDGTNEINCGQVQPGAGGANSIAIMQSAGAKQPKLSIYYATGNPPQFNAVTASMMGWVLLSKDFTGCQ